MALDYHILGNKKTIELTSDFEGGDTVTCKDLLYDTFNKNYNMIMNAVTVTKEYTARPDLISLALYGTDEYADIICKINGISNPFELNEGDIIFAPIASFISNYLGGSAEVSNGTYEEEETILKKLSNYLKLKNETHNPSELTVGTLNYVIDRIHNLIYY